MCLRGVRALRAVAAFKSASPDHFFSLKGMSYEESSSQVPLGPIAALADSGIAPLRMAHHAET
jgi:hypothetical protein